MIWGTTLQALCVFYELAARGYRFFLDEDGSTVCYTPPQGFGWGVLLQAGWEKRPWPERGIPE